MAISKSERMLAQLAVTSSQHKVAQAKKRIQRARLRWRSARALLRRGYRSAKLRARARWKEFRRVERERINAQIKKWAAELLELWAKRRADIKRIGLSVIEQAKKVEAHERLRLRELAGHKARVAKHVAQHEERERAGESDETVVRDLEAHHPELVPVFRKIKADIKAGPRRSRTEAMLEWAEDHPDEVASMNAASELTELSAAIREHEAAERKLHEERESGRRDYATRKAARIERLRTRAGKARAESESRHAAVRAIEEHIPLGQPILVGHHSEGRHRRDIRKIQHGYQKALEEGARARRLEARAATAEKSRVISSDDPNAPDLIRRKIAELEQTIETARKINDVLRLKANRENPAKAHVAMLAAGVRERTIDAALRPDPWGRVSGVPRYVVTNAQSEMRRLRWRLENIERVSKRESTARPEQIGSVRLEQGDNRVRLYFPGKPSQDVRTRLKGRGFHWSPTEGAWQRKASEGALYAARSIAQAARHAEEYAAHAEQNPVPF